MKKTLTGFSLLLLIAPAWSMEPAPSAARQPAAATTPAAVTPLLKPAATPTNSAVMEPAVQTTPAATTTRRAQDRLELDTTQITGNRELPRVLYVVPWKHSDLGDLAGRPANSLLDEVLAPVDRDVFRRQNRYYEALKPDSTGAGASSGTEVEK